MIVMPRSSSRRRFLQTTAAGVAAATFVPARAFGANDRLHVASIGVGGKGRGEVRDSAQAGAQIVALCDVDRDRAKATVKEFPNAPFYEDFREMLEKQAKTIDAVTVSTPDHTHCVASVMAMQMGKHCYCQKPLTRTIWEARQMAEAAKANNVATQMGNQAHAGEAIRRGVELIRAGLVGKVQEVHTWTNRPIWPQGMESLPAGEDVPKHLNWDLWVGPGAKHPYSNAYVPFKWRGWRDYGCGALGDMACHIMDMPYWALDLGYPTTIEAEFEDNTKVAFPNWQTITYRFPATDYCVDDLRFVWYDGVKRGGQSHMPPEEVTDGAGMPAADAVSRYDMVIIGEKGKFFFQRGSLGSATTSPADLLEQCNPPKTIRRVPNEDVEWQQACKGGPPALSNFVDYAGRLTEVVLAGDLPVALGKKIEWDGKAMVAKNAPEAETLVKPTYREGWEMM
jgi:predicted dehydrogenase